MDDNNDVTTINDVIAKALAVGAEALKGLPRFCHAQHDAWLMTRVLDDKIGRRRAVHLRAVARAKLDRQTPLDWPAEEKDGMAGTSPSEAL